MSIKKQLLDITDKEISIDRVESYKAELIQKIEKMESLNVFGNFCGTADGEMLINKKKVLSIIKEE